MMTPEQQYPSTDDCARSLEHDDDPVLLCLRNARRRIVRGHSRSHYILGDRVCAIGAVFAEAGVSQVIGVGSRIQAMISSNGLEMDLTAEAKEAIRLLNEAALELHPEAENYETWSGPLEWVNQELWPDLESEDEDGERRGAMVKEAVLAIYDLAIAERAR